MFRYLFKLLTYLFVLSKENLNLRMYCFRAENALCEDQKKHQCHCPADSNKAHCPQNLLYKLEQAGIHRTLLLEYETPETSTRLSTTYLQ